MTDRMAHDRGRWLGSPRQSGHTIELAPASGPWLYDRQTINLIPTDRTVITTSPTEPKKVGGILSDKRRVVIAIGQTGLMAAAYVEPGPQVDLLKRLMHSTQQSRYESDASTIRFRILELEAGADTTADDSVQSQLQAKLGVPASNILSIPISRPAPYAFAFNNLGEITDLEGVPTVVLNTANPEPEIAAPASGGFFIGSDAPAPAPQVRRQPDYTPATFNLSLIGAPLYPYDGSPIVGNRIDAKLRAANPPRVTVEASSGTVSHVVLQRSEAMIVAKTATQTGVAIIRNIDAIDQDRDLNLLLNQMGLQRQDVELSVIFGASFPRNLQARARDEFGPTTQFGQVLQAEPIHFLTVTSDGQVNRMKQPVISDARLTEEGILEKP